MKKKKEDFGLSVTTGCTRVEWAHFVHAHWKKMKSDDAMLSDCARHTLIYTVKCKSLLLDDNRFRLSIDFFSNRGCWNNSAYQRRRDARLYWRVRLINPNIFLHKRVPRFTWESGLAAEKGKRYQRATAALLRNICSVLRLSRRKPKM